MRLTSISQGRGFSRRTTKEFIQFLFIAKGSTAEVQSQLYVALDQGYINQERFNELYSKSDEVARLLSGFIQYLLKAERQNQKTQETQGTEEERSKGS
jgi:four helix bundle protein